MAASKLVGGCRVKGSVDRHGPLGPLLRAALVAVQERMLLLVPALRAVEIGLVRPTLWVAVVSPSELVTTIVAG
jgi:hypothetical protein